VKIGGTAHWLVQGPGWLLFLYLVFAQAIPAFDYQLGIDMGTQEPATRISEVGVAFWKGFAWGDLLVYIPLLGLGLSGHARGRRWGIPTLAAALGITIYWPLVCLAAVVAARGAQGWHLDDETAYWVVLPLIAAWGAIALWLIGARLNRASPPGDP
jgi:hypothetical protein